MYSQPSNTQPHGQLPPQGQNAWQQPPPALYHGQQQQQPAMYQGHQPYPQQPHVAVPVQPAVAIPDLVTLSPNVFQITSELPAGVKLLYLVHPLFGLGLLAFGIYRITDGGTVGAAAFHFAIAIGMMALFVVIAFMRRNRCYTTVFDGSARMLRVTNHMIFLSCCTSTVTEVPYSDIRAIQLICIGGRSPMNLFTVQRNSAEAVDFRATLGGCCGTMGDVAEAQSLEFLAMINRCGFGATHSKVDETC